MSDEKIIQLLINDFTKGWNIFITNYSDLVYSVITYQIPPTLNDEDTISDLYLFIMTRLQKLDYTKFGFKCKLSTWLVVIIKNMIKDYYRKEFGRKTIPKAIESLSEFEKRVFDIYYTEGYFDSFQVYELLKSDYPEYDFRKVKMALDKINSCLSDSLKEKYINDRVRLKEISLDALLVEAEEVVDSFEDSGSDPESILLQEEHNKEEIAKFKILNIAIKSLSMHEKNLIKMKFYKGLSMREIADQLGIKDYRSLYHQIAKIIEKIKFLVEKM